MATLASPTPIHSASAHWAGGGGDLYRGPSKRTLTRTTSGQLGSRRGSPLVLSSKRASKTFGEVEAKVPVGDSSDDEDLAPIKLSAEAREILGEEASQISSSPKPEKSIDGSAQRRLTLRQSERLGNGVTEVERSSGSPVPRGVQQGPGTRPQPLALGRDGSFFYKKTDHGLGGRSDAITPAPQMRTVRINGSRSQTRSPPSSSPATRTQNGGSETKPGSDQRGQTMSGGEEHPMATEEDPAKLGPTTVQRSRRGEEHGLQSTMRVKRAGKMTGSFLNGPVRRGMIRRQSEDEDVHPQDDGAFSHGSTGRSQKPEDYDVGIIHESPSRSPMLRQPSSNAQIEDNKKSPPAHYISSAPSATLVPAQKDEEARHEQLSLPEPSTQPRSTNAVRGSNPSSRSSSARVQSMFKVPPPPELPSSHDQENEPPPTFKRSKPAPSMLGEVNEVAVLGERNPNNATSATHSPQRKPLAPRSQNTPHRVAPQPPPKMSVLEAATSNAGSTRSKKRVAWSVNGKLFTRLDCIGRGGSSRVYRVMAENYKMFALKRVNLEEADAASIIGYKGEIDLLRRLENVERVVRLFDYEINDEKGELKVLMEMGESDFNRMLNLQIKSENAKFDPSFTRHYWREMLECVQAVHDDGIVHSDLKPANFLVVQGRLKIIDFGIANAIQDNTVNVHRENQIGTPNYMSPEALVDCNAVNGRRDPKGQLLKIGKPSDVWSLGCILYQMVYGAPPFAHIANAHQRIMSIPNPKVAIKFPAIGVGGVPVPSGLTRILRRCLEREQRLRPTIPEMLSASDPFLNPKELMADQVIIDQPMLGQVLQKVVHYCRSNPQNLPIDGTLNEWAGTFLERIGKLDEGG
jgi:serine/threonine-protein kinase TTK/MPS1